MLTLFLVPVIGCCLACANAILTFYFNCLKLCYEI